jgi:hypothetical protein
MKKLILVLAIALMAVPAMALDVYMTDNSTTKVITVAYKNADAANLPRAFAVKIVLDGTGVFTAINGYKTGESTSADKGFGIFPARINIASTGTVNSYGNPLADSNDAGATGTGLNTNTVVLEFGSLYYGDVNAPATSGTLCTLTYTQGSATKATLTTEATYRGGIVLEDGTPVTDTNEVVFQTDCYKSTGLSAAAWADFGKPNCWCFKRQCKGDADGVKSGLYWVYTADLNILKSSYQKQDAALKTVTNGICADFDHTKSGLYRVYTSDLNILKSYYQKTETNVTVCDGANVNFWKN